MGPNWGIKDSSLLPSLAVGGVWLARHAYPRKGPPGPSILGCTVREDLLSTGQKVPTLDRRPPYRSSRLLPWHSAGSSVNRLWTLYSNARLVCMYKLNTTLFFVWQIISIYVACLHLIINCALF